MNLEKFLNLLETQFLPMQNSDESTSQDSFED